MAVEPTAPRDGFTRERARLAWDGFVCRCPRGPAMLVLAVLLVLPNGITLVKASNIAPLDEEMWIDHLIHGSELQIAHSGDRLSVDRDAEEAPGTVPPVTESGRAA